MELRLIRGNRFLQSQESVTNLASKIPHPTLVEALMSLRSRSGIPKLIYPMGISGILTHGGGYNHRMATTRGRVTHRGSPNVQIFFKKKNSERGEHEIIKPIMVAAVAKTMLI